MTDENVESSPFVEHDEVETDRSSPSSNPIADGLNIMVSVPESIEIEMVDSSVLSEYELWFFISSILASVVIGFFVAVVQSGWATLLVVNGFVFGILFLIATLYAFKMRRKMKRKAKKIEFTAKEIKSTSRGTQRR